MTILINDIKIIKPLLFPAEQVKLKKITVILLGTALIERRMRSKIRKGRC